MTLLLNPWAWLAAIVLLGATNATTAFYTWGAAKDDCIAEQARDAAVAQIASETAAEAIAKIQVRHTTVRQETERIVSEKPVYRDCRSDDDVVRLYNSAIPEAKPGADPGKLPAENTTDRP